MAQINKARLIGRLQAQIRVMEAQRGARLAFSTLGACRDLLTAIADAGGTAEAEDFDRLHAAYLGIGAQVEAFLALAAERAAAGAREAEARIQARETELETLRRKCAEAQRELENGQAEFERESANLAAERQELERQLDDIPDSVKEQRRRFNELEEELRALREDRMKFSPEKQAEEEERRDRLAQEVEHRRLEREDLERRIGELEAQRTTLIEKELPALRSRALDLIRGILSVLGPSLDARKQEMAELQKTADALTENLNALNRRREGYRGWLEADRTPLEAMMRTLNESERATLRNTLDPAQCEGIRQLLDQAKSVLDQLDRRLDPLLAACETDVDDVRRRATRARATCND